MNQLWKELTHRWSPRLPGELYTSDLRIHGEKRIIARTSGAISNLTGFHDRYGVFVAISEAQGEQVESAAFDAALANAVDDASRIVVVGNPVASTGRFFEVSRKPTWRAIRISAFDHPNIQDGGVVIPGGPAPTWPAEMAAEFGAESAWYQSRVLGEFPTVGSIDALFRRDWVEAAMQRHAVHARPLARDPMPVVALDVARSYDRDESVAAIVQGARVDSLHAWHLRDLVATADRCLSLADRTFIEWARRHAIPFSALAPPDESNAEQVAQWNKFAPAAPFPLVIDAPSVGSGVVDVCRDRKRIVTEWWGWLPPKDAKRFLNQRAEAYWFVRTLLESGTAEWPLDAQLTEEALAMEWSQDTKGRIVMISKEELRKALKRSPDRLDAVVMGLYVAAGGLKTGGVSFFQVAM